MSLRRILIFGNSASGKSTLAAELSKSEGLAHLDLDHLAWLPSIPPQRNSLEDSRQKILEFISQNNDWLIEGCYIDLLEIAKSEATEVIFMNLPVELCIENAINRPWEPLKYESKEAQDKNLDMLIDWISQYTHRRDIFSLEAHLKFYEQFDGTKTIFTSNVRNILR